MAYTNETRRAFLANLDDPRHGTRAGYSIAQGDFRCHCPKCEAFRAEYNKKGRERKARLKAERDARRRKPTVASTPNPLDVCTVDEVFKPMMGKPSIYADYCVVCGSTEILEQHHPVKPSEGKWIRDGREVRKPTLTLCRKCHSKVHSHGGYLWFRWKDAKIGEWASGNTYAAGGGCFEFLELSYEEARKWKEKHPLPNGSLPSKIGYMNALEMKGWRRIR